MRQIIYELEKALLEPSVRHSRDQLIKLLADDFIEFGSSGNVYNKADVIASLLCETSRTLIVDAFDIKELSKELVLSTYKITEGDTITLRSSIWKHSEIGWQIVFHQGTIVL